MNVAGRDLELLTKGEQLRVLNLGVSHRSVCGVRDYAQLLADELTNSGQDVRTEWLERPNSVGEVQRWIRGAPWSTKHGHVDVVLWHYSVFAYGNHGIPTVAWPLAWALHRAHTPVVTVLHEYAFPWGRKGWQGAVWAASQRLVLPAIVGASSGLVVTVEERAAWLRQRAWLPHRATVVAPVFSNLPETFTPPVPRLGSIRVGMFGYPTSSAQLITEAIESIRKTGIAAELWLLGAPGPNTGVGEAWRRAGDFAGLGEAMGFAGILRPEALASEVSRCDILVFDDVDGQSSRKTTLAAALASGRPVVAIDGPDTWAMLVHDESVRLVGRQPAELAAVLLRLVSDSTERDDLGARGKAFYERHQARSVVAATVAGLLREQSILASTSTTDSGRKG